MRCGYANQLIVFRHRVVYVLLINTKIIYICRYGLMDMMLGFHPRDKGSIPFTCSKKTFVAFEKYMM